MLATLTIIATCYFLVLVILVKGWRTALRSRPFRPEVLHPVVTVVIPTRNEAPNIAALLGDLERQTARNFDVIVVDDHSEDDTVAIARQYSGNATYRLTLLGTGVSEGKKAAITAGVRHAQGSVILTTDADCRIGPRWIESVTGSFGQHVKFVSAGVRIRADGTFAARVQAAEFASLIGVGASSIGLGHPIMCNGANMAFTREIFLEVEGYAGNEDIASGDDVFLLQKIHARYPGSVVFCPRSDAVVETTSVSWRNFVDQRVRWAAKWKYGMSFATPALAAFIAVVHLSWLLLIPAAILTGSVFEPVALLLMKALFEMLYLRPVHRFLSLKWSGSIFVLLQLTYSLYVVLVGILTIFKTPAWKGRKIKLRSVEIHSRLADNR